MNMYKNTNILTYFKPFAQPPRSNKRSLPEDKPEEAQAIRRSRSTTPKISQSKEGQDGKGEPPYQGPHRTSSPVTLRSASRQRQGLQDEESVKSAEPAQAFRDENLQLSISPPPHLPVSRDSDVRGLQYTSIISSQRVVRNGELVIKNSDEESGSDSSLENLEDLLLLEGRKGQREASCSESQLHSSPPNRNTKDGSRMSRRPGTKTDTVAAPLRSAPPVQAKRYKFDLETLVRYRKQEEASTGDFTQASAMLRSLEQQKVSAFGTARAASSTRPLDATFVDMVMKEHGDEDELSRLKAAIQRTEAFSRDKSWSFFDEQGIKPLCEQSDFSNSEDDRLGRMLRKTTSRQQAFLSGYISGYAMKERLPEEIILWIMEAICLESRDDLRYTYTATLIDASKELSSTLSPERINMLFRKIGATVEALDVEGPLNLYPALSQRIEAVSRPNLLSILDLFRNIASSLGAETRMHVICILCRLVLDHSVAKSCHVISAIEDAFASLVESIPQQDLDSEVSEQT